MILGKASPEDIHPVKYAKHNFVSQNYLIG